MRKIGEGDKSEVFALPNGRILKLFFSHYAELAPVEAEISRQLERAGVVLPTVHSMMQVDGRPGIVFDKLREGVTLSSFVRSKPWKLVSASHDLADLHAAVHRCTSDELPSQRERLEQEIGSSDAISEVARSEALRRLAMLPDENTVCHNDIHMLNVIVYPGGSILIDWVLATRGNPLADVAGAVLQLRFGEQPSGAAAKAALELGRSVFWRAYRHRYLELRPGGTDELAQWELPVAAALSGRRAGRMRQQLVNRINHLLGAEAGRQTGTR